MKKRKKNGYEKKSVSFLGKNKSSQSKIYRFIIKKIIVDLLMIFKLLVYIVFLLLAYIHPLFIVLILIYIVMFYDTVAKDAKSFCKIIWQSKYARRKEFQCEVQSFIEKIKNEHNKV